MRFRWFPFEILSGHSATFFSAAPTGLSALLAVVRLVLSTLFATGLTDLRTQSANTLGELAVSCHKGRGHATDLGAVHVKRNAPRHHLYIVFLKARSCTVITGCGTVITGLDTGCVLLMSHRFLLWFMAE